MPNKYDLVLLDMDGTIADTDELIVRSMYDLYDKYRGGKRTPLEEIYYFSGPPIRETLKKEFPDVDLDLITEEFKNISWNYYDICAKAFPYVRETIINLQSKGIAIGVVTSKYRAHSVHCLEAIKLDDIITYFVAGDDVTHHKPDPEGIFLSMEHFSIKDKKKVLYIGDNKSDYITARNAGVDVALVTWGPRKIDRTLAPDYWIDDFKEVEEIVNE